MIGDMVTANRPALLRDSQFIHFVKRINLYLSVEYEEYRIQNLRKAKKP